MQDNSDLWEQAHDAVRSGDHDSLHNVVELAPSARPATPKPPQYYYQLVQGKWARDEIRFI